MCLCVHVCVCILSVSSQNIVDKASYQCQDYFQSIGGSGYNGFIQKIALKKRRKKKVIAALVKTAYYCAGFSRDVQRSVSEGLHPGETWCCGGQGQGHHGDLLSGIPFS